MPVLFVAAAFHHIDVLAVEMLHDGDVRHSRCRRGPVAMLLIRGSMDDFDGMVEPMLRLVEMRIARVNPPDSRVRDRPALERGNRKGDLNS